MQRGRFFSLRFVQFRAIFANAAHGSGRALGPVDTVANPKEVDSLHRAVGQRPRVNLRGVHLESAGGDGRSERRQETGTIGGDDTKLGGLRVARRHETGNDGCALCPCRETRVGGDLSG